MNSETLEMLKRRLQTVDSIPTVPTILRPLLNYLQQPLEDVEVDSIVDLVACDKSIAAVTLRMANSPLFGTRRGVTNVRGAVVTLGLRRLRDLLLSCCLARLLPPDRWLIDPVAFWEHSFGCAVVARQFARRIGYPDPEEAYLGGLLHDLGEAVNSLLLPKEFRNAVDVAMAESMSPFHAEKEVLGFTHAETGEILAEHWELPTNLIEVIRYHHEVEGASKAPGLVAIVALSDLLCRVRGLGYGFDEVLQLDFKEQPAWKILVEQFPHLKQLDLERFTFEMDEFVAEVRTMVTQILQQ